MKPLQSGSHKIAYDRLQYFYMCIHHPHDFVKRFLSCRVMVDRHLHATAKLVVINVARTRLLHILSTSIHQTHH